MKALINALALHLLRTNLTTSYEVALAVATSFAEENSDLLNAPVVTMQSTPVTSPIAPPNAGKPRPQQAQGDFVHGTYVPVKGPDGLTDAQRAAVGSVGLCPNCQQPNDDHLPACARYSGVVATAVTKTALPAVQ